MKVSLNWLNEYLTEEIDPNTLKNKFNLMSQEVEGLYPLVEATGLSIGYVKSCIKHENADKLKVCQVDVGGEILQIICGAPNVAENQKVIVALPGAKLSEDFVIKKTKIRGIVSNGMICGLDELGVQDFDKKEVGIYVLDESAPIGEDPLKYMGLDDWVLDLDLTANRADLLSMRGIAHDVKAMFDIDISFKQPKVKRLKTEKELNIFTETKAAPLYYGQLIENLSIKESPYWLKARLLAAGIRPINNVVDITNYVMLEYSQPLHAFDFDKLNSNKILVRQAKKNETIVTLDATERKLLESDIVITDGKNPIALAGVMGGFKTEVDTSTKSILLEAAVFDPVSVRKTSKRLSLKSESSSRYEKGINHQLTLEALNRACELFVELADANILGQASYFNNIEDKEQVFDLSIEKLRQVTGHDFNEDEVRSILRRLDFKYLVDKSTFKVSVPYRRLQFESYQDVIEEIVRIYGYDKIALSLPTTATEGKLSNKQLFIRQLRNHLTSLGFYECTTYSLTHESLATKYDLETTSLVKIMNPINKERQYLRHSTIPALTDVLAYNSARKISDIFLFELGKKYTKENEIELLSGVLHGKYQYSLWQKQVVETDFYLVKGILENVFNDLKIKDYDFKKPLHELPNLHPGIVAEIYIKESKVGWLGKLHPEEEKNIDLENVYAFEMALQPLFEASDEMKRLYQPISKYPSVSRDIALVVDGSLQASFLIDSVKKLNYKSLKSVNIFDVYQGQHLEDGKKSIALTLVFEDKEKTLETKEVDNLVSRIIDTLLKEHQAKLRH